MYATNLLPPISSPTNLMGFLRVRLYICLHCLLIKLFQNGLFGHRRAHAEFGFRIHSGHEYITLRFVARSSFGKAAQMRLSPRLASSLVSSCFSAKSAVPRQCGTLRASSRSRGCEDGTKTMTPTTRIFDSRTIQKFTPDFTVVCEIEHLARPEDQCLRGD
jgi:hypothetical protein